MAKATLVAAPTASEIINMMFEVGDRAIMAPIADECLTLDCTRVASRIMFLVMGDELSLSWLCEVCAAEAKAGLDRLRCGEARGASKA